MTVREKFFKIVLSKDTDLIESFIKTTAIDMNIQDEEGNTAAIPLFKDAWNQKINQIVEDFNNPTNKKQEKTNNNIQILNILISHGLQINKQNNEGNTIFIYACKNGNKEEIKQLLKMGADPTIKNKENTSGLDIISRKKIFRDKQIKRVLENSLYKNYKEEVSTSKEFLTSVALADYSPKKEDTAVDSLINLSADSLYTNLDITIFPRRNLETNLGLINSEINDQKLKIETEALVKHDQTLNQSTIQEEESFSF